MNFTVSRKKVQEFSSAQGDSVRLYPEDKSLQWEEIYFEQLRPDLDCETNISNAHVFNKYEKTLRSFEHCLVAEQYTTISKYNEAHNEQSTKKNRTTVYC